MAKREWVVQMAAAGLYLSEEDEEQDLAGLVQVSYVFNLRNCCLDFQPRRTQWGELG